MINAREASDRADAVRFRSIEPIIFIIEARILAACNIGKNSCRISGEELFENEKDIIDNNIHLSDIIEYLEKYEYDVDIKRNPKLTFFISWEWRRN